MPPRRTRYRKRRNPRRPSKMRRTYKRKFYRKLGVQHLSHQNGIMPNRALVRMKYCENGNYSIPASTFETLLIYNINGLDQPNGATATHQPYGWEQIAPLYNRYRVFKIKWHITVPCAGDRMWYGVRPVNGSWTLPATFQAFQEYPRSIVRSTGYNGTAPAVFKGSFYLPKLAGSKPAEYKSNDRFIGQAGPTSGAWNNPSEVLRLWFVVQNPTTGAASITPDIQLTYYVEFFDPLNIASS